ncbi:MAG TPA: ammonium transporter [Rhodospirillaceae bacterium]|nr:ammonium transporter [Alphaproteobacteria bacterium]MAS47582.1 ammonium transporter [Alphaproteobacteria bacterium]MAX96546.1 ammonium transporter [Alphaproteobacteria bacterium]MBN52111.1 ammonium transporter [Alphaproteobacteria bacterium]HCI45917.1 ammonium transporter [Rhodospirillaceae bacterium]|tara:strand:- start:5394 stop:6740 length:1347 start_codon:yes stop_codon:yes gene_type:complete
MTKMAMMGAGILAFMLPSDYAAAAVSDETAFIFNTFSFLVCGALVMWMAAGFAMLESGLVRSKNTATICLKNIALYAIAGIMYYLLGYDLMYTDVSGYIGSFSFLYDTSAAELALLNADEATPALIAAVTENGYSVMSDWFFQMVFVATAASIVSGTLAERIKLWPFLIFAAILSAIIYPIQGSWTWGGGWLSEMGFSDFAGSTIVHSVGGWAALVGALILGPRKGKYNADGSINPMPGANLPLATLGTFVLWLGWFGFNGGSQLALGSALDASAMAIVFVNTNLAACGGVVAAMIVSQLMFKKVDLTMALNGAIAGLVSITAGPDLQVGLMSIIVGAIGGVLVVLAVPAIDKLKIDDVVGAISAHLVAGIWGTLAVAIFGSGDLVVQITGIVAVAIFVSITSAIVWFALKFTIGIRVSEEDEESGLDKAELGMEAYPEFGHGSQTIG